LSPQITQMNADKKDDKNERDPETYAIIGAAMAVHSELGSGFLEPVYQKALAIEFEIEEIPFKREFPFEIRYRNRVLDCKYRTDFVCYDSIIVELKALDSLQDAHYAQVINYLKATGINRALLLNFGSPRLDHKRIVYNYHLRHLRTKFRNGFWDSRNL